MGLTRTKSGIIVAGDIADAAVLTDAIADEAVTAAKFDDTTEPMGRVFYAADTTARDALTARASDRCLVTGQGDHGVWYFYDGSNWIAESGQLLETVTLGAAGSITLSNIVSGFSKLVVRFSLRSDQVAIPVGEFDCFIDGDTTQANYHSQYHSHDGSNPLETEQVQATVGRVPAATAPSDVFATGEIEFVNYDEASRVKHALGRYVFLRGSGRIEVGSAGMTHEDGSTGVIDTSLQLAPTSGDDFVAGSWAELWGY